MKNRNAEYWSLVGELSQPPEELERSVERARKRARRAGPLRRLAAPAASLAAVAAAFVLLVNVFPTFALACSGVPIVRELAAAAAFSPSLAAAVEHDYVQYIGQSQTVDGVTVKLEYAIVDKHQAAFFYSTDAGVHMDPIPRLTAPDGESVGGYASRSYIAGAGFHVEDLNCMTLSFVPGMGLPERITLELFLNPRSEQDTAAPPSAYAPEEDKAPVPPWEETQNLRFAFDVTLDPARISGGETVEVGRWVELDGQRILVDRLELYPTRTILYLGEDSGNSAWLRSLKFFFEDGKGRVYDDADGVLTASGKEGSDSYLTYYFQSFYYAAPENLTLHITKAEWLNKDAPPVRLDLATGACSGLPEDVSIDGVTPSGDGSTVMVKMLYPSDRAQLGQTFSQTYRDPEGGEHSFTHWGSGTEYNDAGQETGSYELLYFDDYPWDTAELELNYTGLSQFDPAVQVDLF